MLLKPPASKSPSSSPVSTSTHAEVRTPDAMTTANLLDFDLEGLAAFCERLGEKRFRATQLFRWIHQRGASDFSQMTDLAKTLREKLATTARVEALPVVAQHESADGTIKWLFDVGDGN